MAKAKVPAKKAKAAKAGDRDPTPFLFIPSSHGSAYWLVHKVGCKDIVKDWINNNSSGRTCWDIDDTGEGRTVEEAVNDHISDLVAGGHEVGAFRMKDYHINSCCK